MDPAHDEDLIRAAYENGKKFDAQTAEWPDALAHGKRQNELYLRLVKCQDNRIYGHRNDTKYIS